MRGVSVLGVAKRLGLEVQPARGSSGGGFRCPACNAQRRHTKTSDKRAAAGVRNDGLGWRCFQCDVSGDALNLVAYALRGKSLPELHDSGIAEVRQWCETWLGLDHCAETWPPTAAVASEPEPPRYPPLDEVRAFWASCGSVNDDPVVSGWLRERRALDPSVIAELDLARAIGPDEGSLPPWAGYGGYRDKPWRSWPSQGLRLVVPLYAADGGMRSLVFRRVFDTGRDWPPKSMAANGYQRAGLVMANAVARHLLEHPLAQASEMCVVIQEGETDWLTGCQTWARRDERAVFGLVSGSWTSDLAARIPRRARVIVRTDNDAGGDQLAEPIIKSLVGRCDVRRGGKRAM